MIKLTSIDLSIVPPPPSPVLVDPAQVAAISTGRHGEEDYCVLQISGGALVVRGTLEEIEEALFAPENPAMDAFDAAWERYLRFHPEGAAHRDLARSCFKAGTAAGFQIAEEKVSAYAHEAARAHGATLEERYVRKLREEIPPTAVFREKVNRMREKRAQEALGTTISPGEVGQAVPEGDRPPQSVAAAGEDVQD
jgi:hypothetical protein